MLLLNDNYFFKIDRFLDVVVGSCLLYIWLFSPHFIFFIFLFFWFFLFCFFFFAFKGGALLYLQTVYPRPEIVKVQVCYS